MKRLRFRSVVDDAVERVSVVSVLRRLGVDIESLPSPGANIRVLCPFEDVNHSSDLRDRRQMRVYSDNRAYCHACQMQYTSVSLMAVTWGCSYSAAARRLLDGVAAPAPTIVEVSSRMPVVRANMAAALGVWADGRGVDRTGAAYGECLARLDAAATEQGAWEWLCASKRYLES